MNVSLYPKFEKIIKGQATYQSSNLGCNLLISRLNKSYAAQPTPAQLQGCLKEMDAFFDKYSSVLTKDLEIIKSL